MAHHEPGIWSTSVPNRGPSLIIVAIVFGIITTFFFIFRQAWRWAHRQRGWDDVMAAFAYAILLIQTVFEGIAVHYGFGKQRAAIAPTLEKAMMYFYLYQICYKLLGGFTKLTFCFLYLRIFSQKGFQRAVITVAVIVASGSIAFALGTVFQCTPVDRAFNRKIPGHCINNVEFWYTHAAFNIVFDIVVYVLPIPMIGTLKLGRGQKTGLISIFSLGAFVIAAAIVRMVMLRSSAHSTDPTWGSAIALNWTEIEANCSVICCCLPALRVPFLGLWHRIRHGKDEPFNSTYHPAPMQHRYGTAWSGPQQSQPVVSHPAAKHDASHHSNDRTNSAAGSNGKSSQSHTSSKTGGASDWVDRILNMNQIHHDDEYDTPRSESQQGLSRNRQSLPEGLPSTLELGAIYKTTDLRVSTHDADRELEHGDRRQLSMKEMLDQT